MVCDLGGTSQLTTQRDRMNIITALATNEEMNANILPHTIVFHAWEMNSKGVFFKILQEVEQLLICR